MKTTVICYIYDLYKERGVKAFEKKVNKLLKDNGLTGKAICHNAYLERGSGYGSYYKVAVIELNGEDHILKSHTHDSELWDNWENPSAKEKRNLFLAVLSEVDLQSELLIH